MHRCIGFRGMDDNARLCGHCNFNDCGAFGRIEMRRLNDDRGETDYLLPRRDFHKITRYKAFDRVKNEHRHEKA